jgi:hypothetical protein
VEDGRCPKVLPQFQFPQQPPHVLPLHALRSQLLAVQFLHRLGRRRKSPRTTPRRSPTRVCCGKPSGRARPRPTRSENGCHRRSIPPKNGRDCEREPCHKRSLPEAVQARSPCRVSPRSSNLLAGACPQAWTVYRVPARVALASICPSVNHARLTRNTIMLQALAKPGTPRPVTVLLVMTRIVPSCVTAMEE